jgi:hypothetical protein
MNSYQKLPFLLNYAAEEGKGKNISLLSIVHFLVF